MKRFTLITLFPDLVASFCAAGVIGRADRHGLIEIASINPREFSADRRGTVDDAPYGGGPGMVMTVAPLRAAIARARQLSEVKAHVVYPSPQGRRLDQAGVAELASQDHLIFVAGRYEGIDERVVQHDIDSEWSIGDFVVSGGELPALIMIDAVARTLPGILGHECSALEDSFCGDLLDYPHYTRPESIDGQSVPAVLTSGDHAAIARWRRKQRLGRTFLRRPDLLEKLNLSDGDQALLRDYLSESGAPIATPGQSPESGGA